MGRVFKGKKEELLNLLLKLMVVLGAIAYVPSLLACMYDKLYLLAAIDTAAYAVLLTIFFLPRSNYHHRLYAAVLVTILLGTAVLYTTGTEGAGHVWLLCAVFISALFGERRIIIFTILFSQAAMLSYGVLIVTGFLDHSDNFISVFAISANMLLVSIILAIITYNLLNALQREIDTADEALELLHHRVKNNLQSIESIIALDTRGFKEDDNLSRRVHAVSSANELVIEETDKKSVSIAELFRVLSDPVSLEIHEHSSREIPPEKVNEVAIGLSDIIDIIKDAGPLTVEIGEAILIRSVSPLPSITALRQLAAENFFPQEWIGEGEQDREALQGNSICLNIPFRTNAPKGSNKKTEVF